ncbi:MAG: bifunctional diaminohydroxyphosphoribosylaminopyrimidine deaminase/5-amino-6-(5-phosphoribosylamino)uracil reductase RibD [Mongoliibacter sp.]|uniref:bifunctional diaminohydroxyphosphoribosylaminopyrimidine deaminase/5-amino-6-(5-phosphoribosylamino)uracil reductase RibD n=1 Tax=Mongoliibacter sp. TaxID=2022438 RepID=UPI0012F3FD2F|nr:bifunctional diaminohydroxyphosphoribosylaminopyrimidine deaminase/5-amino-6-(5-phosphoribosylamino)uracil reductase RibD [Mongoliibacter sp.]TVP49995.1 MAG: bifunctional diaminohydroxyphosphoribosylaminopyrimidine deaminase/5-amino-6-(5-phosphoribosylamino)uracil reductase RibD [Mongoliibacter sp.]
MGKDERYMGRALDLALLGMGSVSPNPMVGCVIVHQDKIIGEGYHMAYGGPHAEPNAIHAVKDSNLLKEATAYVTLEPCSHWGKTPPCADLLIEKKIKRVVIAAVDSNPLVGGNGIKKLKEAGIEVQQGVLEKEALEQNRRFFTFINEKRPYIILKWAQTQDGFVAKEDYDSKWISNSYSRQMVHKWRSEEDGILVGTLTAKYDNPRLNVREWVGKNPIRIVIDRNLSLDKSLHLFDKTQSTLCYNQIENQSVSNLDHILLKKGFDMEDVLEDLYERKIQSVFVEGGARILNNLISKNLWDEARVFTGPVSFGRGIEAPTILGLPYQETNIMGDKLKIYRNINH